MRIEKIKIKGFRTHVDTEIIGLRKFNVFLGYNAAGKSTIVDAIKYALTGTCRGTDDAGRGAEKLATGGTGEYEVTLTVATKDGPQALLRRQAQGPRSQAHARILKTTGLEQDLARVLAEPGQYMRLSDAEQKALLMACVPSSVSEAQVSDLLGPLVNVPGATGRLSCTMLTKLEGVNELERQIREKRPLLKHDLAQAVYTAPEKMPGIEASAAILKECQDDLSALEAELRQARDKQASTAGRAEALSGRLKSLDQQAAALEERINSLGDPAQVEKALTETRGKLDKAAAAAREQASQVTKLESEIAEANATLRAVKDQAARLQGLKASCPTCSQPVPAEYVKEALANLRGKYERLNKDIKTHQEQVNLLRQVEAGQSPDDLRENINALSRALGECTQLRKQLQEVGEEYNRVSEEIKRPIADTAGAVSTRELEDRIAKGRAYIADVQVVLAERDKAATTHLKRQRLQEQLQWAEDMMGKIGPKGTLRAKLLDGGLSSFLADLNVIAGGLGLPVVDISVEPWATTVGGLPAVMMSESERYRLSMAFAGVFAKRSGAGILCLDGAEVLDDRNRELLVQVIEAAGLEQAIVVATRVPPYPTSEGDWAFFSVGREQPNGRSVVALLADPVAAA